MTTPINENGKLLIFCIFPLTYPFRVFWAHFLPCELMIQYSLDVFCIESAFWDNIKHFLPLGAAR